MAKVTLKVAKPTTGDPVSPGTTKESMLLTTSKPVTDQKFDLRDRLAELVGKGNTLAPDDKAAIYGNLVTMLGKDKAQKVMNHAFIFNSRPDVQKLGLEDKLKSFYTIGSNDPEVMEVIGKTKNLGYGVVPGFRSSSSDANQQLQGRTTPVVSAAPVEEIKKKVMLRVGK